MKKSLIMFIVFLVSLCPVFESQAAGQNRDLRNGVISEKSAGDNYSPGRFDAEYLKGYIYDTSDILTSPSAWGKREWVRASVAAGITAVLYLSDQEIRGWSQRRRGKSSDDVARIAKPFGDGRYTLPSLGLLYIYGRYTNNSRSVETALLGMESLVVSGLLVQVGKEVTHRYRPDTGARYDKWDGPSFSTANLSFPSGHASSAFAVATVVASQYHSSGVIPALAYGIASLTAFSRVNDDKHWASDVFAGSAIGYFTAKAVMRIHERGIGTKLAIIPVLDESYSGLLFAYQF